MERMKFESDNLVEDNVEKIGKLFPNCITESKDENDKLKKAINFDMLKQMLSEDVVEGDEKYEFTWVGKKESIVEAHKPIRKTLRPCKEESVNWDKTENLYIEGDNLEVLKLLQESYLGKVKMIYIDPPYNTGNDFIYRDDSSRSQHEENVAMGMYDEDDNKLFINKDTSGKFHSDWCSMIYPRLTLARNLLSNDGVIFISIDDNEVRNLKNICDEIFGERNFITKFIWKKTENIKMDSKFVSVNTEYILCYRKNNVRYNFAKEVSNEDRYNLADEKGKYYLRKLDSRSSSYSKGMDYIIEHGGIRYYAGGSYDNYLIRQNGGAKRKDCTWLWSKEKFRWGLKNNEIVFKNGNVYNKVRYNGEAKKPFVNYLDFVSVQTAQKELDSLMNERIFDHPKPIKIIKYLINLLCDDGDIILDFFSGSSTTAHATMQYMYEQSIKLKMISVQFPEKLNFQSQYKNICEIGKERIRRAGNKIKNENPDKAESLDIGFRTFKLDTTNMKDVYYSAGEYTQNLLSSLESNIKEDRTDLDLLFGCLLEWGLPLSMPYKSEIIDGFTIHTYNDGDLIACFDENVSDEVIKTIANRKPLHAVFRDSSFKDSPSKINVGEIFKMISPDTKLHVM